MSIKSKLITLASVRLSLHRKTQVIYKAPGFLFGTYIYTKRGKVSNADLITHAIEMRYGLGYVPLLTREQLDKVKIEIIEVN